MSFAAPQSVQQIPRLTKSVSARRTQKPSHPLPTADALPVLKEYYETLFSVYGPQHWWPGRSRFEVIVGAILMQNTSWINVERAISNLRREKLLALHAIQSVRTARLAQLIRSSGYFRQKARKLKAFADFVYANYANSLTRMFRAPTQQLRQELLAVHGIGPETADSILLYAGRHPVFVIDSYTRRILERHGLASARDSYEHLRSLFERTLPADHQLFNEFHALIVHIGKTFCRKSAALCESCPLRVFLPANSLVSIQLRQRPELSHRSLAAGLRSLL